MDIAINHAVNPQQFSLQRSEWNTGHFDHRTLENQLIAK